MTSLVVLVSPPGPLEGIGDALTDWSATDLLHPFLWVNTAAWAGRTPSRGNTPALLVLGGRTAGTSVEQAVTAQRFDRVRLVVLVPGIGGAPGVPSDVEHQIHQAILGTSAVANVDLLRAVVTRPDSGPVAADLAREGWHNILLAPEASRGPGLGHSVLRASTDPLEIGPDAAAGVAGLTGLWKQLDAGPLDGAPAPFGRTLRLARSYYRNLDATAVSEHVRTGLLSLEDGVPLPRQHGSQALYIDDAAMAADDMATTVLSRHAGLFTSPRVAPAAVQAEKIGAWQAIKLLFGFLWASVRNAPGKWYSLVAGDVGSATASRVQELVFGQDPSSYAVVAGGELAGGGSDWRAVGRASANLDQALDTAGTRTHEVAGNFSAVWSDYVDAGLTLMDAGDRPRTVPIQVGTERGVLRHMSDCVPGPREAFTRIPPRVSAAIGISDVRAADPLGQHTLTMRLRGLASQPALARDADTTLRELLAWQQSSQTSYAARTGTHIADQLMRTSEEVRGLLGNLSRKQEVDVTNAQTAARQKAIAGWMRGLLGGFGVLVVAVVVLGVLGILTWWGALLAGGVGLLAWLGGSFVLFLQGQRDLFRDLNLRRAALSQSEADQQNVQSALRDLHRQSEAYAQFLDWTRVLGVVLHGPFGDTARTRSDVGSIDSGLPMSTRIGKAEVDAEAADDVVSMMRRDLYAVGWLSGPWQATLGDAGARLGAGAQDLSADPNRMFAQRAGVQESFLTAWADELERGGVGQAAGNQLWQHAMTRLAEPDYRSRLVSRVQITGAAGRPAATMTSDEFMAGVGADAAQAPTGKFDDGILAREARLEARNSVVQAWPLERSDGLDRRAVLVELGDGLPDYTFDLGQQVAAAPATRQESIIPADPVARPAGGATPAPQPQPRPSTSAPDAGWVF